MNNINFNKKQLAILIDPDKSETNQIYRLCDEINNSAVDVVLVGGSLVYASMDDVISNIKEHCKLPVYIFPGSVFQISNKADGILFISLVSGRNPEYLIGQHVVAAPLLRKTTLDVIPVAYMLIDGASMSSVQYMSHTLPIPANKKDIILATALASEFLGFKAIYLEAGSGAKSSVPLKVVELLVRELRIPIIVGGGIGSAEQAQQYFDAGVSMVVVGTFFENNFGNLKLFNSLRK